MIPQSCRHKAIVPRESFAAALRRSALVTSRDAQSVRLQFAPSGLTISAQSADGSAEEVVECDFQGESEPVGFNPEFLLECLSVLMRRDRPVRVERPQVARQAHRGRLRVRRDAGQHRVTGASRRAGTEGRS